MEEEFYTLQQNVFVSNCQIPRGTLILQQNGTFVHAPIENLSTPVIKLCIEHENPADQLQKCVASACGDQTDDEQGRKTIQSYFERLLALKNYESSWPVDEGIKGCVGWFSSAIFSNVPHHCRPNCFLLFERQMFVEKPDDTACYLFAARDILEHEPLTLFYSFLSEPHEPVYQRAMGYLPYTGALCGCGKCSEEPVEKNASMLEYMQLIKEKPYGADAEKDRVKEYTEKIENFLTKYELKTRPKHWQRIVLTELLAECLIATGTYFGALAKLQETIFSHFQIYGDMYNTKKFLLLAQWTWCKNAIQKSVEFCWESADAAQKDRMHKQKLATHQLLETFESQIAEELASLREMVSMCSKQYIK